MIRIRYADRRIVLMCDSVGCLAHLVSSGGQGYQEQLQALDTTATMIGWRRLADVEVDLCEVHSADAPTPIERGCIKRTWCTLPEGHPGTCSERERRAMPPTDFGPQAAKRRRW